MSDELCINTLRTLSADVVQKANSGHPGAPMGMSPMAYILWTKYMKYSPSNPKWWNRDRFVLSNGHACALQYILLHLTGFEEFTMDQLQHFRQLSHKTPGHPENCIVNGGIEVTTGPLGQGIANAVGLALSQKHLAAVFNKPDFDIFSNHTYVFCGDGCLQEGVSAEASSLAGHLGLGNLIMLYDDNHISIDGDTELSFTEDVCKRYESYGWHTQVVANGDSDLSAIAKAIEEAQKVTDKPSLIKIRTTIGKGSLKEGTEKVHGSVLGPDDVAHVKEIFGFPKDKFFYVPEEASKKYLEVKTKGKELEEKWNALFKEYTAKYPTEAAEATRRMNNKLPENWKASLPVYKPGDEAKATRQYSETCINALAKVIPEFVGGSADLTPSNLTHIKSSKDFQIATPEGRNVRFGVREHGMAAMCNGMIAYGGVISYGATFLNFIEYALGAVRLSALSHFGVVYVMTHDSIALGEDGPTHQPIEAITCLRALPNLLVIRPADGNETSGAYAVAITERTRPTVICLGRSAVPNQQGTSIDSVAKGAYVLSDAEGGKPDLILSSSGNEVALIVDAAAALKKSHNLKVRVVSMPSWELFHEQSIEYQKSVLLEGVPVLAVEPTSYIGWREYAHAVVAMHGFGSSGPYKDVLAKFGFTTENIVEKSLKTIEFYKDRKPHDLITRAF